MNLEQFGDTIRQRYAEGAARPMGKFKATGVAANNRGGA